MEKYITETYLEWKVLNLFGGLAKPCAHLMNMKCITFFVSFSKYEVTFDFLNRRRERNLVRPFESSFLSAVKCYSRSAAGQSSAKVSNIRNLDTLEKTVKHLFEQ